jgi:hypothetical protein
MTFSTTTLSIKGLFGTITLSNTQHDETQHISIEYHYGERHYAECRYAECRYAECRGARDKHTSLIRYGINACLKKVL